MTDIIAGGDEHHHTPDEERRIREAALDETIADSFPASDPPSSVPDPDDHEAVGIEPAAPTAECTNTEDGTEQ